jgi:tetratricopeptide (TPR) repeat protein
LAIDREATLKTAEKFLRIGRLDAAIAEYARVVDEQPSDWSSVNTLGDLHMRAGQPNRAAPLYMRVAEHLFTEGFHAKAAAHFKKVLKIAPGDERAQLRLAEISARQGLLIDARAYYGAVERRRRQDGDQTGADEILVAIGELDPDDLGARIAAAQAVERLGPGPDALARYRSLCDEFIERERTTEAAAMLCLERAVEAHTARQEFAEAADLVRAFARLAPASVDLLLRLVELCVDGGLEAEALEAQALLADAYLATGRPDEARIITEDLLARDPGSVASAARLPEALRMEIDLTGVLGALETAAAAPPPPAAADRSLDEVFEQLRSGAEGAGDDGAEHLGLARTYLEMGMPDEAVGALELAARSPRYRFEASSLLAQFHRDNSDLPAAIEWFERAAEAPAPSPDVARALLYDLGDVLETVGESARALAVFIELRTDAPEYRDVSSRITRLARTEMEG